MIIKQRLLHKIRVDSRNVTIGGVHIYWEYKGYKNKKNLLFTKVCFNSVTIKKVG